MQPISAWKWNAEIEKLNMDTTWNAEIETLNTVIFFVRIEETPGHWQQPHPTSSRVTDSNLIQGSQRQPHTDSKLIQGSQRQFSLTATSSKFQPHTDSNLIQVHTKSERFTVHLVESCTSGTTCDRDNKQPQQENTMTNDKNQQRSQYY